MPFLEKDDRKSQKEQSQLHAPFVYKIDRFLYVCHEK